MICGFGDENRVRSAVLEAASNGYGTTTRSAPAEFVRPPRQRPYPEMPAVPASGGVDWSKCAHASASCSVRCGSVAGINSDGNRAIARHRSSSIAGRPRAASAPLELLEVEPERRCGRRSPDVPKKRPWWWRPAYRHEAVLGIHRAAIVPPRLRRRKSPVTARRPLRISVMRFTGTSMRRASSAALIPSASRSSRSARRDGALGHSRDGWAHHDVPPYRW